MKLSKQTLAALGIGKAAKEAVARQDGKQPAKPVPGNTMLGYKVADIQYDKEKANLDQPQPKSAARMVAEDYVLQMGFTVVETLKEALVQRANGQHVLSPREADIVFRMQANLQNPQFSYILTTFGAYLLEGDTYAPNNPWMLRLRYNRGIHWRDYERQRATAAMQEEGDARLAKLAEELEQTWGLPAHPNELKTGFHPDLCRPETYTEEHFSEGQKR